MKTILIVLLACGCLLTHLPAIPAALMGPPLSIEKLNASSDLIFKGTAVATETAADAWFKPCDGLKVCETKFSIVSVIKGNAGVKTVLFRHYDSGGPPFSPFYEPSLYHFEMGQTYIVFAHHSDDSVTFRQVRESQSARGDRGVVRCADAHTVSGETPEKIIWNELTSMLKSTDAANVTYAIDQLESMSAIDAGAAGGSVGSHDFDRGDVLTVVHDLIHDSNAAIARAAISLIGSGNPFLSDSEAMFWLATVGSLDIPGIGKEEPKLKNFGGERYWKDLTAIASSKTAAETRALSIRAMGLVRNPSIQAALPQWLADGAPQVRAAAAEILADYPDLQTRDRLSSLAEDTVGAVRVETANCVGFAQLADFADLLDKLLHDKSAAVRGAASMNLLSFAPTSQSIANVFRENVDNVEFKPLFLNALGRQNPQPYLDALAQAVEQNITPTNWSGGQIPSFTSWEILFKYLQSQPVEDVRSGKLNRLLDAMEKVRAYSSSEPRDIYAFYVQRGMTDRARRFRVIADKAASYDLDFYFKMVDQDPSAYTRN